MTRVLVAGGGPVGLAAALLARAHGLDVTVVEPRADPVDKACGEGLMPAAVGRLAALGVRPDGYPLRGIRYLAGASTATAAFRAGPGLGVRRTLLQVALADAAEREGVQRVAGRVVEVEQDADRARVQAVVQSTAGSTQVDGQWLLAADGLHSPVRRALGLSRESSGRFSGPPSRSGRPGARYGLRRHFALAPWSDFVEVHWADDAEAYVTPVGGRLVGVAVLCRGRGTSYDEWLTRFPDLRERLAVAEPASAVAGAGPLRQDVRRRRCGRVLLVGDAAGYVDALTGEGIEVGLACAQAAVSCIVAGRPDAYDAAWRRASRRYRWLTTALLTASGRPGVRRRIVPAAAALPGVFAAAVQVLGGEEAAARR
jgi:flavin-dependent dehydrogenase